MDLEGVLGGVVLALAGGFSAIIGGNPKDELEKYRHRERGALYFPTFIFARPVGILLMVYGVGFALYSLF